jgi:hypothetical protein
MAKAVRHVTVVIAFRRFVPAQQYEFRQLPCPFAREEL